jgi:hypothetical protein
MTLPYVTDKILNAITDMATGTGSIQERIYQAWVGNLFVLQKKDFKGDDLKEYIQLVAEATRVPARGDEGAYAATLLSMTDEEAESHANKICELYHSLLLDQD